MNNPEASDPQVPLFGEQPDGKTGKLESCRPYNGKFRIYWLDAWRKARFPMDFSVSETKILVEKMQEWLATNPSEHDVPPF